jgi:hypothetical protein
MCSLKPTKVEQYPEHFPFSFDDGDWIAFHTIFQNICEYVFGVMFFPPPALPPSDTSRRFKTISV